MDGTKNICLVLKPLLKKQITKIKSFGSYILLFLPYIDVPCWYKSEEAKDLQLM